MGRRFESARGRTQTQVIPRVFGKFPRPSIKALHIAQNPDELISLKSKLSKSRKTSPLFNSELFTRNLEQKFTDLIKNLK